MRYRGGGVSFNCLQINESTKAAAAGLEDIVELELRTWSRQIVGGRNPPELKLKPVESYLVDDMLQRPVSCFLLATQDLQP